MSIESPDEDIKQALLYEWYCRDLKLDPSHWESFDDTQKLGIVSRVSQLHKSLLNQCENCTQNANDAISGYGCLSFAGLQEIACSWDTRLVNWSSCPFFVSELS